MSKLCSAPKCLNPARPGQRYCLTCHARKAKVYRVKAKKELAMLRHNFTVNHRPHGTDE